MSVPVRRQEPSSPDRDEAALASNWPPRPSNPQEIGRADHKPSVIVTRRRSLRNSLSESSEQVGTHSFFISVFCTVFKSVNYFLSKGRGCWLVFHYLPQSVSSLSKLKLLNPPIYATLPRQHTLPSPHPCSMSPLPPLQSSTLFRLSLFHLGGFGELVALSQIRQIIRV